MTREKKYQYDVVKDLKELSIEADKLIESSNCLESAGLNAWFDSIKETILKIKNCDSIEGIQNLPRLNLLFGEEHKNKNVNTAFNEVQKVHVHAEITVKSDDVNKNVETSTSKALPDPLIINDVNSDFNNKSSEKKMVTPTKTPCASSMCRVVVSQISTPQMKKIDSSVYTLKNNTLTSQNLMETPVLNRTFNKIVNKTLTSDSVYSNCQKTNLDSMCDNNGTETKSSLTNVNSNELKKSSSGMVTRSGTKRRSSTSKSKKAKRQKINAPITSASKTPKSRQPLVDKNFMKAAAALSSEKNCKLSAVIVPPVQKKQIASKEKQIIEEIKKKEEKANENIKRILEKRQMKAEQNKKNREEKTARTLQKRKELEKEKEQRILKAELEAKKSQAKPFKESIKNSILKTRTQVLIDQHVKPSTPGVLTASKQNVVRSNCNNNKISGVRVAETPPQKNSDDCESYELTPVPNSSTYNFSDDEEEPPVGKRIPLWAQGVHLKSALINQFYYPPNLEELFGTEIEPPNLPKIFSVEKKRYLKRTSSAIWNHTPCY